MRNTLLTLAAAGSILLGACGGSPATPTTNTRPTTTVPPRPTPTAVAQQGATATPPPPAATATAQPAATNGPEPTSTTVAAPTVTTPEPKTTAPSQGAPAGGRNSPLAIPASLLEGLRLEYRGADDEPDPEGRALLTKHGGKPVLDNEWGKNSGAGIFQLGDFRAEFRSAEDAAAYFPEAIEYAVTRLKKRGIELREVRGAPELGDETAAYRGALTSGGVKFRVYLIAFRNDRYFGGVTVLGDKALSQGQAFEPARAAGAQVETALTGAMTPRVEVMLADNITEWAGG